MLIDFWVFEDEQSKILRQDFTRNARILQKTLEFYKKHQDFTRNNMLRFYEKRQDFTRNNMLGFYEKRQDFTRNAWILQETLGFYEKRQDFTRNNILGFYEKRYDFTRNAMILRSKKFMHCRTMILTVSDMIFMHCRYSSRIRDLLNCQLQHQLINMTSSRSCMRLLLCSNDMEYCRTSPQPVLGTSSILMQTLFFHQKWCTVSLLGRLQLMGLESPSYFGVAGVGSDI